MVDASNPNEPAAPGSPDASQASAPSQSADAGAEPNASAQAAEAQAVSGAAAPDGVDGDGDGDLDGEEGDAEGGTQAEADAEGGTQGGADAEGGTQGGADAGTPGAPGTKKKRRRRKKKKAGEGAAAGGPDAGRPKKDTSHLAFSRFFEGPVALGGRRHTFSNGEVIAGRVLRTEYGVITIDLFGKAIGLIDEHEPRTLPVVPQAPARAEREEQAAGDPSTAVTSTGEAAADPASEQADMSASTAGLIEAAAAAEAEAVAAAGEHVHDEAEDDEGHTHGAEPEAPAAPAEPPKVGSVFRARIAGVAESGHLVLVNHIVDTAAARAAIDTARTEHKRVIGIVYGYNRGGFDVLVHGIRTFCPASGMALDPIEIPDDFVGRRLQFSVAPVKQGTHGILVTRRSILERENRKRAKERLKSLKVGERVHGRITQVRDFGFFVDFGGIEGMVHVSEISWDRNVRPEDIGKVGDEVDAVIIKVPDPKERRERFERVGLSMKTLGKDPWDDHAAVLAEGTVQMGKVTRVAEFGAFVLLAPGIEGLLHVSELGKELRHAGDAVKPGDEIQVVIERVDRGARRIALSKLSPAEAKALAEGNLEAAKGGKVLRPGALIKVVVDHIEHHGVFVQVEGVLGKRGRGYISNSDMGTERGTDHRKMFPPGTKLDVKVVGQDRDGGLKCSRKAFLVDEEKRAVNDYRREASKQGFGTFADILRQKLGQTPPK